MQTVYAFDENTTLVEEHAAGVCTNRSASGPIILLLPDNPPPGTPMEIHQVEPYPITIQGQSAGDKILGGDNSFVLDNPGSSVHITYTAPHFWSGKA